MYNKSIFSKNKRDIKQLINKEVKALKTEQDEFVVKKADDLHDFVLIKKNSKKKQNVNKRIAKKKRANKRKMDVKTRRVNKSIQRISSVKYSSSLLFQVLTPFRYLGFLKFTRQLVKFINQNKLVIIILGISIIAGIWNPIFFSSDNVLTSILKNNVTICIMAIGMTFVILTGGIDLSVGSILGFSGMFSMGFLLSGIPTLWAFILGILLATILGFIQGFLISWIKLPPFIVTLVGLLSIRGIVYLYANGSTKGDYGNSTFDFINSADFLGIPFSVWFLLLLFIVSMVILKYTKFGRYVYSVGGNEEAAKLAGINTKKIILSVYIISALFAGIASLFFAAQVSSVDPRAGDSYELDVIAAVVLGGTSLSGGKGGVGKTILGWLVISTLSNALIILGFDSNWQLVFKGLVILIAIILDKNFEVMSKIKRIYWKII